MRKSIMLLLLLATVVLSGCLPQAQAPASTLQVTHPAPTLSLFSTAAPASTARPAATVAATTSAQAAAFPDSGCTVVTKKPTAGPTAASIYPPITTTDWVKGPADAKVTILEYSDFQ